MADAVDKTYFQELADQDPAVICRRVPGCQFHADGGFYTLPVWGQTYALYPREAVIKPLLPADEAPHELFCFFIIYYLLRSRAAAPSGRWISEKDIPGGATFFRGPHQIPTRLISRRYENDIEAFSRTCRGLQGSPLTMGDAAYRFEITPDIPVAVLYWAGDEDFAAEAKLLYDQRIGHQLPPDVIFSLAVEVCRRVGRAAWKRLSDNDGDQP